MKPLISRFCAAPACFEPPNGELFCRKHERYHKIGNVLVTVGTILALFLSLSAIMTLSGCASSGPSKDRFKELLHECREANRERVRIIKEYEALGCSSNPEQSFGTVNFGEAGH